MNQALAKKSYSGHLVASVILCLITTIGLAFGLERWPYGKAKSLPAPLRSDFPFLLRDCKRLPVWGGDNCEMSHNGKVHYLVLQGIDSPKPGQPFYKRSRRALKDILQRNTFSVMIVGRDEMEREIARVYVEGIDVNLKMLELGMVWFDGNEFADAEQFKSAEQAARAERVGLWVQDNPIHPSDFEETQRLK